MGQVPCGGILQADDIAIMALTPVGLQNVLLLCENYSQKWRYKYHPAKSKVLIFGEGNRAKACNKKVRKFILYGNEVEQVSEGTHVGIILNTSGDNTQRTANAVSKMRGSLMSIVGSGINPAGMSCLTAVKLYNSIVLPRGLHSAELWFKISNVNLKQLETVHHFCLKLIQNLPKRTKSVVVNSMVNMYSLETIIDIKKLLFLGRMCRLNCD